MELTFGALDYSIVVFYLAMILSIGFIVKKLATAKLDNYFLAGRNMPWWLLGSAGCSSYMDMAGIMVLVGVIYYTGAKSVWLTSIYWGWLIMAGYMAFQAKWIRKSGVMTFAEWNKTRFGDNRDAQHARLAAAIFLLVLMVFNLVYVSVALGKFAEVYFPMLERWQAILIIFAIVGTYVTLGGFFGVVITDVMQTVLIAIIAIILLVIIYIQGYGADLAGNMEAVMPGWSSAAIDWHLWDSLSTTMYADYTAFGPLLMIGFSWMIFRILAGPNVWDFTFFLTARSPRDASMAAGLWTAAFSLRWIVSFGFLILGLVALNVVPGQHIDAENIMPQVLNSTIFPTGLKGIVLAILLASSMAILNAMVNVTSSVIVNDIFRIYVFKNAPEKRLVRMGQLASIGVLIIVLFAGLAFTSIVSAWETMLFVVVTMILVPATMRWHWWRYSAKGFVYGMIGSALFIIFQQIFLHSLGTVYGLGVNVAGCLAVNIIIGFLCKPTDMDVLVKFYAKIQPFGFWGPVRREAEKRGLVKRHNKQPIFDAINLPLSAAFQVCFAFIIFFLMIRQWEKLWLWGSLLVGLIIVLYFTWYKTLPAKDSPENQDDPDHQAPSH